MPVIDLNGLGYFKDKENAMIAGDYSASKTYAVGDYVYYNGTLYKCKTAITTAEAWTAAHWTAAKLADDLTSQSEKIDDLKSSVDNLTTDHVPVNLLNPANITVGKYWKAANDNGRHKISQIDNDAFCCAYIDVVVGKSYIATGISYNAYNGDADGFATGVACASASNTPSPVFDTTATDSSMHNTDKTTTRLYFSWKPAKYATETYIINEGTTLATYQPYFAPYTELASGIVVKAENISPQVAPEIYTVDINGGGDYTSFIACLVALQNNSKEKIIYVKAGTYDIFEEIGGATFAAEVEAARQADPDNYSWFDCSTVVPPHTKIIGVGEVVFEFKPESNEITTEVMSLLSPVNVIYDIYMENITIDCDNCRYGIHDDTGHNEGMIETRHIYKNVKIIKARTNGGMNQAFGCGMMKSQYMEFDGCDFSSPKIPFSFHNKGTPANDYTDQTIIVIKNCIANPSLPSYNAMRFGNVNGKQVKIDVRIFNTYFGGGIWVGNESETERPNAYALTLCGCGDPTITVDSQTNIYTPVVYQIA